MPTQGKKAKSKKEQDRPKSRASSRGSRGSTGSQKPKESAVLSDGSLSLLAREIAKEKENGLVLPMYLCVPNTAIVNACNAASEYGLLDANDTMKIETCTRLLLEWKTMKAGCKEREKIKDLDRALREMGKADIADTVNDRHANNTELTSDAFSS